MVAFLTAYSLSSITWGAHSTDETGYRKSLHTKLAARGNEVDFVGGTASGAMTDNDHEGHRGFEITAISQASRVGIYAAANIVLVHVGTNDMKNNANPSEAPGRLQNLINSIFTHSKDAVVFVCQIIPASPDIYPETVPRIKTFNAAIPDIVAEYVKDGKKVMMVSMHDALSTSDLDDGLHPNNGGYEKMANKYYDAIEAADEKGWITKPGKEETPPLTPSLPDDSANCLPTPSWYRVGEIATGAKV